MMENKQGRQSTLSAPHLLFPYCRVAPAVSFSYLLGSDITTLSYSSKNTFAIPLSTTHLNYSSTQQEVCRDLETAYQNPKQRARKDTGDT